MEEAVAAASGDAALAGFEVEVAYDGFACEGYTLEDKRRSSRAWPSRRAGRGAAPPVFGSTATTAPGFQLYGPCPAVCFGPHAESVHGTDERVLLPSMVHTAQVAGPLHTRLVWADRGLSGLL